jgi:hypothetical protein
MASVMDHIVARKRVSEAKGICLGRLIWTRSVQTYLYSQGVRNLLAAEEMDPGCRNYLIV